MNQISWQPTVFTPATPVSQPSCDTQSVGQHSSNGSAHSVSITVKLNSPKRNAMRFAGIIARAMKFLLASGSKQATSKSVQFNQFNQ